MWKTKSTIWIPIMCHITWHKRQTIVGLYCCSLCRPALEKRHFAKCTLFCWQEKVNTRLGNPWFHSRLQKGKRFSSGHTHFSSIFSNSTSPRRYHYLLILSLHFGQPQVLRFLILDSFPTNTKLLNPHFPSQPPFTSNLSPAFSITVQVLNILCV